MDHATTLDLIEIGDRFSKTPSQVALRWLIEHTNVLPSPCQEWQVSEEHRSRPRLHVEHDEVDALRDATCAWRA
jgi:diketogulonate reductase-like aldo/keto reductase